MFFAPASVSEVYDFESKFFIECDDDVVFPDEIVQVFLARAFFPVTLFFLISDDDLVVRARVGVSVGGGFRVGVGLGLGRGGL